MQQRMRKPGNFGLPLFDHVEINCIQRELYNAVQLCMSLTWRRLAKSNAHF